QPQPTTNQQQTTNQQSTDDQQSTINNQSTIQSTITTQQSTINLQSAFCNSLSSLRRHDCAEQPLLGRVRRDEEILRRLRNIPEHVGVDDIRLIEVQAKTGQILEAQVAVVVDLR